MFKEQEELKIKVEAEQEIIAGVQTVVAGAEVSGNEAASGAARENAEQATKAGQTKQNEPKAQDPYELLDVIVDPNSKEEDWVSACNAAAS